MQRNAIAKEFEWNFAFQIRYDYKLYKLISLLWLRANNALRANY